MAGSPPIFGSPCGGTVVGKGQMGSALMGSLQISCFLTEGLFGYPLTYFYLSKSARAYLFPQSVKSTTLLLQRPLCIYIYTYIDIYVCMCVYIYIYISISIYLSIYIYIFIYISMLTPFVRNQFALGGSAPRYVYVCVYVCVYAFYIYIYIYVALSL